MFARKKALLAFALVLVAALGFGQAKAPTRILSQPVLDKFIRDFPAMSKDLAKIGSDFDSDVMDAQDDPASFGPQSILKALDAVKADAKVKALLTKFGWDANFWNVYYVIFSGVYVAMMDQAIAEYPDMAGVFGTSLEPFRAVVHKDDLALILRNLERLTSAFDDASE